MKIVYIIRYNYEEDAIFSSLEKAQKYIEINIKDIYCYTIYKYELDKVLDTDKYYYGEEVVK